MPGGLLTFGNFGNLPKSTKRMQGITTEAALPWHCSTVVSWQMWETTPFVGLVLTLEHSVQIFNENSYCQGCVRKVSLSRQENNFLSLCRMPHHELQCCGGGVLGEKADAGWNQLRSSTNERCCLESYQWVTKPAFRGHSWMISLPPVEEDDFIRLRFRDEVRQLACLSMGWWWSWQAQVFYPHLILGLGQAWFELRVVVWGFAVQMSKPWGVVLCFQKCTVLPSVKNMLQWGGMHSHYLTKGMLTAKIHVSKSTKICCEMWNCSSGKNHAQRIIITALEEPNWKLFTMHN